MAMAPEVLRFHSRGRTHPLQSTVVQISLKPLDVRMTKNHYYRMILDTTFRKEKIQMKKSCLLHDILKKEK
jgi:hypothetical protein